MLEGMLNDTAVRGQAAELLEPVYAGRANWPALIQIGEIRLLQVEEPAQRLAWTKRIARLYEEQLEDYDGALRWYGKVFQESPTERLSLEQLIRLADKLNRWEDLASLLAELPGGRAGRGAGGDRHRAPHGGDLRPPAGTAAGGGEALSPPVRRAPRRSRGRAAVRGRAGTLGRLAGAARADRRGGRARRRSGGEAGAAAPEREAGRGEAGQPRARHRDAARGDGRRSRRSRHGRGAGTAARRRGAVARAGRSPRRHPGSHQRRARGGRGQAAARRGSSTRSWTTWSRRSIATPRCWNARPGSRTRSRRWSRWRRTTRSATAIAVILEPVYRRSGDLGKLVGALAAQLETVDDRAEHVRILREMAEIHQRLAAPERAFDCPRAAPG